MMRPVPSEKTEAVVEALTQEFSEDRLNLIRYVATDSPSSKFYSELKAVCPQLLAISRTLFTSSVAAANLYRTRFQSRNSRAIRVFT